MPRTPLYDIKIALEAIVARLDESATPYAIIGGFAVSQWARPRTTKDLDLIAALPIALLETALGEARGFGLVPAFPEAVDFARQQRILQILHRKTRIPIDMILASSPFEMRVIKSGAVRESRTYRYRVVSPEYLLAMKIISGRPQDILDCHCILEFQSSINWRIVEDEVQNWGVVMENPKCGEILDHIKRSWER
ncbi:MAG: hypothetical protein RLZZ303_2492 [Candidatus Hydrogenedentota bacterium]